VPFCRREPPSGHAALNACWFNARRCVRVHVCAPDVQEVGNRLTYSGRELQVAYTEDPTTIG